MSRKLGAIQFEALRNCELWAFDEPFSLRASITGSFVASSLAWDQKKALWFCDLGGIANKDDLILVNNRVVALARIGNLEKAKEVSRRLEVLANTSSEKAIVLSTLGLLSFRCSDYLTGRAFYLQAKEIADHQKNIDLMYRVRMHWLYEEAIAGTVDAEFTNTVIRAIEDSLEKIPGGQTVELCWSILKQRVFDDSVNKGRLLTENQPILLSSNSLLVGPENFL